MSPPPISADNPLPPVFSPDQLAAADERTRNELLAFTALAMLRMVSAPEQAPSTDNGVRQPAPTESGGERERHGPEMRFVLSLHTPQNAEAIAKNVAGCKVIVFEAIGHSEDVVKDMNSYVAPTTSPFRRKEIRDWGSLRHPGYKFHVAVLDQLIGSGARIEAMDVPFSDWWLASYGRNFSRPLLAREQAIGEHETNEVIKAHQVEYMRQLALGSLKKRDPIMEEQLQAIADHTPDTDPVGVVCGALHETVYRALDGKGYRVGAVYELGPSLLQPHPASGDERVLSYESLLYNAFLQNPDAEPDEALVNRILLTDLLTRFALDVDPMTAEGAHEHFTKLASTQAVVVENMADDEVTKVLQYMDDVKQQELSPEQKSTQLRQTAIDTWRSYARYITRAAPPGLRAAA